MSLARLAALVWLAILTSSWPVSSSVMHSQIGSWKSTITCSSAVINSSAGIHAAMRSSSSRERRRQQQHLITYLFVLGEAGVACFSRIPVWRQQLRWCLPMSLYPPRSFVSECCSYIDSAAVTRSRSSELVVVLTTAAAAAAPASLACPWGSWGGLLQQNTGVALALLMMVSVDVTVSQWSYVSGCCSYNDSAAVTREGRCHQPARGQPSVSQVWR